MKKMMLILVLSIVCTSVLQAQVGEWFNQKKTQRKYLMQQIAALNVYIDYAQKGYKIAKTGLGTIGNLTNGEFNLHTDYFNSLRVVNPIIKDDPKIEKIVALQYRITEEVQDGVRLINNSDAFTTKELAYIIKVYTRVSKECESSIEELEILITDGKLEMKDSDRMQRIDKIHSEMEDRYEFCKSFVNENEVLAVSRKRESGDVKTGRILNGVKPDGL